MVRGGRKNLPVLNHSVVNIFSGTLESLGSI